MSMSPAVAVAEPPLIQAWTSVAMRLSVTVAATLTPFENRPVSALLMSAVMSEDSVAATSMPSEALAVTPLIYA